MASTGNPNALARTRWFQRDVEVAPRVFISARALANPAVADALPAILPHVRSTSRATRLLITDTNEVGSPGVYHASRHDELVCTTGAASMLRGDELEACLRRSVGLIDAGALAFCAEMAAHLVMGAVLVVAAVGMVAAPLVLAAAAVWAGITVIARRIEREEFHRFDASGLREGARPDPLVSAVGHESRGMAERLADVTATWTVQIRAAVTAVADALATAPSRATRIERIRSLSTADSSVLAGH